MIRLALAFTTLLIPVVLLFAIPRPTRHLSAFWLLLIAYAQGVCCWLLCAQMLYHLWGFVAVFIGVLMAGIGVVLLTIVASVLHGAWMNLVSLAGMAAWLFGLQFLAALIRAWALRKTP